MSAFKQFLSSDIIVTPFEVNKGFVFPQSQWGNSDVKIDRLKGVSGSFETNQNTSGEDNTEYEVLVYNSIKELYYSNFITRDEGGELYSASLFPGSDFTGDVLIGSSSSQGRYENYLSSTLTPQRSFNTSSGAEILVFSVPSRLHGDYIQPNSFQLEFSSSTVFINDDGEGNLVNSGRVIGNVIYQHGLAILAATASLGVGSNIDSYGTAIYGTSIYGGTLNLIEALELATDITCSFSSSHTIYETQYKATVREKEFNYSLNPSLMENTGSGEVYNFVSGSDFQPYVTTVGLYDNNQNLLAVGKLSQPYPLSRTTDTSIFINIDK